MSYGISLIGLIIIIGGAALVIGIGAFIYHSMTSKKGD